MKLQFLQHLLLYILLMYSLAAGAQGTITGRVMSADGREALPGAVIRAGNKGTLADRNGNFSLAVTSNRISLTVSFIGYQPLDTLVNLPLRAALIIELQPEMNRIEEVTINTGYQQVARERATGSFISVDEELLSRRVAASVLNKIEDVVPGLLVNRGPGNSIFNIRGQSTIQANANPLIILDNFPYEGNLESINPNDVENITILKDAAAASIWGARAGNGVIVISTKKGKYNQPPKISVRANYTLAEKPDLFYQPQLSSGDFIAIEQALFARGFYTSAERSAAKTPLSPVVELLIARRDGKLSAAEANARLAELKATDVRNELEQYYYRQREAQQYALSVNGGSGTNTYAVSGGFDKNLPGLTRNSSQRITFNASNTYRVLKDKLELSTGLYFIKNATTTNNTGPGISLNSTGGLYPYARLADEAGNALPLAKDYRLSYTTLVNEQYSQMLDWSYRPLNELKLADNTSKSTETRFNAAANYALMKGLKASLLYQYSFTRGDARNLQSIDSYYTRNQINRFSSVNAVKSITRPIPLGDILDTRTSSQRSNNLRTQLNFDRKWNQVHGFNALAGWEMSDMSELYDTRRLYGYDDEHASGTAVNYAANFPSFVQPGTRLTIPFNDDPGEETDRYLSYYANAAYSFRSRYIVSASVRKDEANIFGVNANQKGVPLWSAGLGWVASEEAFWKSDLLPYLKLRVTYGLSGNVDKSVTAYTTANYSVNAPSTFLPYARISTLPNPDLRWEKVRMINLGLDFESRLARVAGTFEYYFKKGTDISALTILAPQTGMDMLFGNYAATRGRGFDLSLNSRNLRGAMSWNTAFMLSHVMDKITRYDLESATSNYASSMQPPLEGKPQYALFSYKWYGLDPATGDPLEYLNGELSKNYSSVIAATRPEDLVYHGSARPTWFGSLRNSFSYHSFSASALISYRLGYWFRRSTVYYGNNNGLLSNSPDYALRWQQPGDEAFTQVPSVPAASNSSRDNLYRYSELTAEKGDHIRLQDINIGYELLKSKLPKLPVARLQLYLYLDNLGLIWKANKAGLDPDYRTMKPAKSMAFGLRADI